MDWNLELSQKKTSDECSQTCLSDSSAFERPMIGFFGITKRWTGAFGLMSLITMHLKSTISAFQTVRLDYKYYENEGKTNIKKDL